MNYLQRNIWFLLYAPALIAAQSAGDNGYFGYSLTSTGDEVSTTYETASTPANVSTTVPEPDVFLNASLHVGEISIVVEELSAKLNLDAQVLQLLQFNAGVDVSIERVSLKIEEVNAEVMLEVRLANLLTMISDVLESLDLNPVLATLGQDLVDIVGTVTDAVTPSASPTTTASSNSSLAGRAATGDFVLTKNILYSVNNYSGNTHTNRVLAQNGDIVDESLDNQGVVLNTKVVGSFLTDMVFTGYDIEAVRAGEKVRELEYTYNPFVGLEVVSAIYLDDDGTVVATRVLSETGGGGSSSIEGYSG
ncbi:hypothetical protein PVAG01_09442 [Phlyctema vagabunda]|uniref:Uncharacterized protein n=1 Tax=Phlyctema vagabunda TaxID=108571 RepID=A0ABR4P7D8_9HELO